MTDQSTSHRAASADPAAVVPRPQGRVRTERAPAPSVAAPPQPPADAGPAWEQVLAPTSPESRSATLGPSEQPSTLGGADDAPEEITAEGTAGHVRVDRRRRRRRRATIALVVVLVLALGLAAAAAAHLYRTSEAWEARSEEYRAAAEELGGTLAGSQADLAGARAELDAVRSQLATQKERIDELANEKAQLGDDRAVQQQLIDYQERVSTAAGDVALALDQCVQGQNQLIGYMENADQYDPVELEQFGTDVQALCQAATEANIELQRELAR